jgi:hypothetical protein
MRSTAEAALPPSLGKHTRTAASIHTAHLCLHTIVLYCAQDVPRVHNPVLLSWPGIRLSTTQLALLQLRCLMPTDPGHTTQHTLQLRVSAALSPTPDTASVQHSSRTWAQTHTAQLGQHCQR